MTTQIDYSSDNIVALRKALDLTAEMGMKLTQEKAEEIQVRILMMPIDSSYKQLLTDRLMMVTSR